MVCVRGTSHRVDALSVFAEKRGSSLRRLLLCAYPEGSFSQGTSDGCVQLAVCAFTMDADLPLVGVENAEINPFFFTA